VGVAPSVAVGTGCGLQRDPTGFEPGDGDAKRWAGDVVEPAWWKKYTELGSPPCSPQTPILRSGRVARPRSVPILTSSSTPSMSRVSNGLIPKMPISR